MHSLFYWMLIVGIHLRHYVEILELFELTCMFLTLFRNFCVVGEWFSVLMLDRLFYPPSLKYFFFTFVHLIVSSLPCMNNCGNGWSIVSKWYSLYGNGSMEKGDEQIQLSSVLCSLSFIMFA